VGKMGYYEMSAIGTVMEGLVGVAKATQAPAPEKTVIGRQAVKNEFHQEDTVAGVNLESYLKREPDEGDKFVKVIYHEEWVEKVPPPPVPPTPEQIAARERKDQLKLKVKAVLTGVGIVTAGVLAGYGIRSAHTNKAITAYIAPTKESSK
jgi:hypothetical protein